MPGFQLPERARLETPELAVRKKSAESYIIVNPAASIILLGGMFVFKKDIGGVWTDPDGVISNIPVLDSPDNIPAGFNLSACGPDNYTYIAEHDSILYDMSNVLEAGELYAADPANKGFIIPYRELVEDDPVVIVGLALTTNRLLIHLFAPLEEGRLFVSLGPA